LIRPIEYTVLLDAPQTQTIRVRMRIRSVAAKPFDVALPVWRQGKYAVINPASTVRSVTAQSESGKALSITKTDKTTWRIEAGGAAEVVVTYTIYANSLNDRTRHVDDTHAFLSGATVFMYVPDRRNDAIAVHLDAPADWRVACGLKHEAGKPRTLLAPDYDTLIDSPIEVGLHQALCFEVEGKPHDIAVWGDPDFDSERLERDFAKIIKAEAAIFGDLPYERYVFILHVAPGLRGGTEHLNSTVMQVPQRAFEDEGQYKALLSLTAHEMFHTWNVKRLRPAALRNIDLSKENYTDLLWFCEGTTSYYDELVPVRAGFETPEGYLQTLAESIYQRRARPAMRVQSVAEASFDAWIKFGNANPDDVNSSVSYYDTGSLISLLLDLELRKRSGNKASLDTLMHEMYKNFPSEGPGFTMRDLIDTATRLGGLSFDHFFSHYIYSANRLPFEDLFETVGLEMIPKDNAPHAYIGLLLQDDNSACMVRSVLSDGPAFLAGVNPGDEVVSMNGRRFKAADLMAFVDKQMTPGETVWLQVLRRNRLRRIEFNLETKLNPRWNIKRVAAPTAAQKEAYASWLGSAF
jgi:predicted metalloprotease with PDZ domain